MKNRVAGARRPATIQRRPRPNRVRAGGDGLRQSRPAVADPARVPTDEVVTEERPWGAFEQLACNEEVTVKVITVEAGHRLSLQKHDHRGEMWQVLDGPVDVTLGSRTWSAACGERVWVPQGAVHRMGNSTDVAVRVLEVGFGHFDEEDIHRLEDDYAR